LPNDHFEFKQFTVWQSSCSQKVSTDACIFGAWTARCAQPGGPVLDIGAGTGLLMLMLAQKHPVAIHGIEIEPDCFQQSKENISKSKWHDRLEVFEGDAKNMDVPGPYGLVLSNPPFYENQLASPDQRKNMAWHSSKLSLGDLFTTAGGLLDNGGEFAVIVPYTRKDELSTLAASTGFHPKRSLSVRHTLTHTFTRYMVIYTRQPSSCIDEWLEIKTADGEYSAEMIRLMADYYLFL
jgi:tRNA1Val (adenine37-N6)-methyltransferase